jgi:hypothetical protein
VNWVVATGDGGTIAYTYSRLLYQLSLVKGLR